jgi:hypothetical protein
VFFHYDDIQELVIVDDDWHLNILLILPILSISSFFSVAHDMMISINISLTIDNVTIFSIRFDYSAFDDIHN